MAELKEKPGIEKESRQPKRRTRAVSLFANGASLPRLTSTLLNEISDGG